MNNEQFIKTLQEMEPDEKVVTMVLYMKDIKDLLESICDHYKIDKKHY